MDILLWRWSTAVQLTSAFMIAVFFVVLSRSIHRPEVIWWRRAWVANFAALVVTLSFWLIRPSGVFVLPFVRALYLGTKIAFVLLIFEGAWVARHAGRPLLTSRQRWIAIVAYAVIGGILLRSVMHLGLVQHGVLALAFFVAAFVSLRGERGPRWLAAGLIVRALVALGEAAAYGIASGAEATATALGRAAALLVAASSSIDTGAEWLLALGCVLVVSDRIQHELQQSNRELLAAQDELRALADRDALTGLSNRRALPSVMRNVQPQGATVLFFDLDDFKAINDLHGHETGDRCLKAFASALQSCFRPEDSLVRYGGDEFLVIASGIDASSIGERIALVRERLRDTRLNLPAIHFSVGQGELAAGGKPDDAVRSADAAMYAAKQGHRAAM